jgi:hypothetical protein
MKNIFLVYILLLLGITGILSAFPGHNGDMPFYIACAIEKNQGSMDGVADQTLAVLRTELPAKEFQEHAERFGREDPVILERYRIKPFYILIIAALHRLGFTYVRATVIPSLICYFLIGLCIWQYVVRRTDPLRCFLVSMACCLIYPSLVLARLSTPDSLSCFIVLNALLLIYTGRSKALWLSLFVLAIAVRLDNLVCELIFLFFLWKWPAAAFKNKLKFSEFLAFAGLLSGTAFLVNLTSAHRFFWFMDPHFSSAAGQYKKEVLLYIQVLTGSYFMGLVLLFIFSGLKSGFSWKLQQNYFFYTVCVVVIIRFLLYPFYDERYFTPLILSAILVLFFGSEDENKWSV